LKREYETLGWLELPELGRRERPAPGRLRAAITITVCAVLAAIVTAIAAAS
tara:strand:+ start:803 stop:955 length:153 start_codon:yes stop_codon:yes gene_type:complete